MLHVYRVTARVTVDGAATTATSADCTLDLGETGTGFRNDARLIHGTTTTVTDCAPFPAVSITKTLTGAPVQNGDGTTTISYDLTVTSTGAVATSYTLADALRFGTGATIVPGLCPRVQHDPRQHHREPGLERRHHHQRGDAASRSASVSSTCTT